MGCALIACTMQMKLIRHMAQMRDLPIYSTVLQAQTGPELAELCMHNHSADRLCPMTLFYP